MADTGQELTKKILKLNKDMQAVKDELDKMKEKVRMLDNCIESAAEPARRSDEALKAGAIKSNVFAEEIKIYKDLNKKNIADISKLAKQFDELQSDLETTEQQLKGYTTRKKELEDQFKKKEITKEEYNKLKDGLKKELGIK